MPRNEKTSSAAAFDGGSAGVARGGAGGAREDRLLGIDLVRLLAAAAVVWLHTAGSEVVTSSALNDVGRVGTTFLNVLAAFFTVMGVVKHREGALGGWLLHRGRRILGAWVIWGLLYAGLMLARMRVSAGMAGGAPFSWDAYLEAVGWWGSFHLWFLPYLFVVTLVFVGPVRWILARPGRVMWGAAALAGLGGALTVGINMSGMEVAASERNFAKLLVFRTPAFCYGLAVGVLFWGGKLPRVTWGWVWPLGVVAVMAMWVSTYTGWRERTAYRVAGACVLLIGLAPWRGAIVERLASLGRLGFGVYLCHELFIFALGRPLRALFPEGRTLGHDVALFAGVMAASLAFTWLLKRSRWTRWTLT
jgi:peptidoglycan/LPS O-acetylase OafA/YrhL